MKKYNFFVLGFLLFASAGSVFAQGKVIPMKGSLQVDPTTVGVAAPSGEQSEPERKELTVSGTVGDLKIRQPDGSFKDLPEGYAIKDGDVIQTGEKSGGAKYSYGSEINMAPNSEFKFEMRGQQTQHQYYVFGSINITFGYIRIKAWIKGGRVLTLEAICAVRGTDLIVRRDPVAKVSTFYLYEGLVDIDNRHGKIIELHPGETMSVDSNGKMTPGTLGGGEWEQLVSQTAAEGEAASEPSENTPKWPGIILLVLCTLGGVFIYQRMRTR